jgi:aminopeptidase N
VRRLALAAVLVAGLLAPAAALAKPPVAGSPGGGDPFFPSAGNGGYDARHYSLRLRYDQAAGLLSGRALLYARATESLYRFNLDLRDFLSVSRVTVDGRPASFSHTGQELAITPRHVVKRGRGFVVAVEYAGTPEPVVDPDESIEGWVPTGDGAFVVNEPQGAPGWFPVNDTPRDKATYDVGVTVPQGKTAMGNGTLLSTRTHGGWTTWRWLERKPMASYLVTATNGVFQTRFDVLPGGIRLYDAVDPQTRGYGETTPAPAVAWERLAPEPEIVRFFSELYGRYPFESAGGIVDWAPDVGYALESQTKPNYDSIPDATTVVHELSHQWWGDAVTPESWPDIWLNEGFATWSEWIYAERHGGDPASASFDELCAVPEDTPQGQDLWFPAPAALAGPEQLFGTPVYARGAMTLQALRELIGDPTFFRILRSWYAEHRYGNVSTADFVALAERLSGRDLGGFFQEWLYREGRPTDC